jgi:hypothetical protein
VALLEEKEEHESLVLVHKRTCEAEMQNAETDFCFYIFISITKNKTKAATK